MAEPMGWIDFLVPAGDPNQFPTGQLVGYPEGSSYSEIDHRVGADSTCRSPPANELIGFGSRRKHNGRFGPDAAPDSEDLRLCGGGVPHEKVVRSTVVFSM